MASDAGRLHLDRETGRRLVMLAPGLLMCFLAFRSGGFFPGATALAAAEMALLLGLRFTLARRPLRGVSPSLAIAVAAMACFAAWTLLSSHWSHSVSRALPEYSRALLYGLTLLFFGSIPFDARRIAWIVYGVAGAAVAVSVAALTARLLPRVIFDPTLVHESRLGYPLTYWNALGILACVGLVLCVHLACSTRDPRPARVLGAGAVPLLSLTLLYTLSRGGIWAAAGALAVYLLLGRPRALLSGAIAAIPPTLIAIAAATPTASVTDGYPLATVTAGRHVALVLAACVAAAMTLRACLLPLDGWLTGLRLPDRARRPVLASAVALALALVLAAGTAADVPQTLKTKYEEFTDRADTGPASGESRLLSARPEDRFELWSVALDAYREDPLRGSGAGTYALGWDRDRPAGGHILNAHSLYLEVLGELGLVGLALLAIALALILGAFAYRARGPDRALFAALLAAGLAWAVHAGVDWDWQMPAVTLWLFAFGGAALARSLRRRRRRPHSEAKWVAVRVGGVAASIALAILPARVAISQARLDSAIDAMHRGDCRRAGEDARGALSAVGQRPTPYAVIAFCDIEQGLYRSAAASLERARRRDPRNSELYYDLAIARASAGQDPAAAARTAVALNPLDLRAREAEAAFANPSKRAWLSAGRGAALIPPTPGDP